MVAIADCSHLPTEDTKDKVEHEEGADDNERHKVNPVKETPQGIISLKQQENVGELSCFWFLLFGLVGSLRDRKSCNMVWLDSLQTENLKVGKKVKYGKARVVWI